MSQNVKIPIGLFHQTIDFLECFDSSNFDPVLAIYHQTILFAFQKKKLSLNLRNSYSKIIHAKDEDTRHWARMNYLQKKRELTDYE